MADKTKVQAAKKSSSTIDSNCPAQQCKDCKRRIEIYLETNDLIAYQTPPGGKEEVFLKCRCVTGKDVHDKDLNKKTVTPSGEFKVEYKGRADHRSSEYDGADGQGAPMYYPVYFAPGGIAIHYNSSANAQADLQVKNRSKYGSHGCVRVSLDNAKKLWCWAKKGDPVSVKKLGVKPAGNNKTPASDKKTSTPATDGNGPKRGQPHKVQSGDTMYNIAKRSGVSVEALQKANPQIVDNQIKVGQTVNIP